MTPLRRGASLIEVVIVLGLFGLILGGMADFVRGQARIARAQLEAVRFAEAVRASRVILGGELRTLAAHDVRATGPDSLRVRAFRGGGRVCSDDGTSIGVRYRGYRQPEPAKDSVVLIGSHGESYFAITGATGSACGGEGLLLVLDGAITPDPVMALVFETGAYHLADGALRYRRGSGGRQPLIEAILAPTSFIAGDGVLMFGAMPNPDELPTVRTPAAVVARHLNPMAP